MGCCFLLQGIFLTQGSSPHLLCFLHWLVASLRLHRFNNWKNRTKQKNWRKKESQHFLNELINLDFYSLVQSSNLYSNYCLCLLTSLFTGREWRSEVKWSEVAQSCPTLCDPMDCSLSGSSIHGIFQARMLEWISISFSRGPFHPRNRTQVSRIAGRRFTIWTARKPQSNFFF